MRQLEAIASTLVSARRRRLKKIDPQLKELEDELRKALGTKVSLSPRKKGGRLIIDYFSQEDLARILQLVGVSV